MKKIVLFVLFSCLVAWSYAQDDDDPPTYDEIWINVYPEPPMPTDQVPVPITVIKTASDISVMFLVQMDEVLIEFLDSKETVVLKKVVKGDPLNPNGTYTIRFTEVKASDNTYEGCFDVAGNDE